MKRNPFPKNCRVNVHRCCKECECRSRLPVLAAGIVIRVNRETLHVLLRDAYEGLMTQDVLIRRNRAELHLTRTDKPAPRKRTNEASTKNLA